MTETLKAELALDARATLGECIRWDAHEKLIYWVESLSHIDDLDDIYVCDDLMIFSQFADGGAL